MKNEIEIKTEVSGKMILTLDEEEAIYLLGVMRSTKEYVPLAERIRGDLFKNCKIFLESLASAKTKIKMAEE